MKKILLTILLLSPIYLFAMDQPLFGDDGAGSVNTGGGETQPLIEKNSSNSCAKCCAKVICFPCLTCDAYNEMRAESAAINKVRLAQSEKEKRAVLASMQHVSPAQAAAVPTPKPTAPEAAFCGPHLKTACTWAVCFPFLVIPECWQQFCFGKSWYGEQDTENDPVKKAEQKVKFNEEMRKLGYEENTRFIHSNGSDYYPLTINSGYNWKKQYRLIQNNDGASSGEMR